MLEIGKEYPPPGEDVAIEKLRALHLKVHQVTPGPKLRGEHPKQHGGLWAIFEVQQDIPKEFRTGIFEEPRSYTALVRYSNGRTFDDRNPDVHGMAIKVLTGLAQQDFILADHPVFFARDVQHILDFLVASSAGTPPAKLAMTTHPKLIGFTSVAKTGPLGLTYWSQTPYQAGNGAVKYLAVPAAGQNSPVIPPADSPDWLAESMVEQLTYRKIGAKFDLCVNPQTDSGAMPVEDATVEWTSPPVRLATVSIYPQKFNSPEQMSFVENLSWTPWNSLPENKPLGGINRARRGLYDDSSILRHSTKGIVAAAPTGRESF